MSLIVARMDSGRAIILGDTKLTYKHKDSNPYLDGCLKQYMINSNLAIAFAGIVEHFENVLPSLYSFNNASDLIEYARVQKQQHNYDFDLIASQIGEDSLHVLKGVTVTRSIVAHIGDTDAFGIYQKAYMERESGHFQIEDRANITISQLPEPLWENEIYSRMTSAFNVVLQSEGVQTVCGMLVSLCSHKGNFQYMHYVNAISDPFKVTKVLNSGKPIDFGTAEFGSFSVELCDTSPNGGSPQDIGFYFLQGGFGLVFPNSSSGLRRPLVVQAENPAFWVLNTSKIYGVGVASGYMTPDHCGLAGEVLMNNSNWQDAVYCYELGKNAKDLKSRIEIFDRYKSGYAVAMFNWGKRIEAIEMLDSILSENQSLKFCNHYLQQMKSAN